MCNKGCKHIGQKVIEQDNMPEGVLHQLQGCLSSNTRPLSIHQILWRHCHRWQTFPGLLPTRNPSWLWKLRYCWGNVAFLGNVAWKEASESPRQHTRERLNTTGSGTLVPAWMRAGAAVAEDPNDSRWPHIIHQSAPAWWCTLRAMNPWKAGGPDGMTGRVFRDLHRTADIQQSTVQILLPTMPQSVICLGRPPLAV